MKNQTSFVVLASALAVALPATVLAASPTARAELQPRELAVDTPAQLTISIAGERDGLQPPSFRVPDATVRYRGQMSRATIINGKARNETTFMYTLVPSRTGAIEIPSIEVTTRSGTAKTDPIRATVTNTPPARSPGPRATAEEDEPARPEPAQAFIKLDVPKRTLYVGEAVPVKIRAYFRAGTAVTTQGPPELSSDAFTLSELSAKPVQQEVELRGEAYLQATWTAVLTPAKPSAGQLGVGLPVELAYRERARQRRSIRDLMGADPFGGADPFADPFFGGDPFAGFDLDSMFDTGAVRRREVTLRANAGTVQVVEPPAAKRPAGYTGAVGTFDVAIDAPSQELRVGEPITLTIRATGTGSFERLSIQGVAGSDDLKAYPVHSTFAPSDSSTLTGTKTFTQIIVPTRAGDLAVPAVSLVFFDPNRGAYVTARTQPLALHVLPPRAGAGLEASSANAPAMTPARVDPGESRATLQPRFRAASFWFVPGALVLATAVLVGAAWWRRSPRVADALAARRVHRAVRRALADMDRAAAAGDSSAFFLAARGAFQARLGDHFGIAPTAVTAADVEAHLGARGQAIRSVFEHADGVAYARGLATAQPLDHWRAVVRDELVRLEATP